MFTCIPVRLFVLDLEASKHVFDVSVITVDKLSDWIHLCALNCSTLRLRTEWKWTAGDI